MSVDGAVSCCSGRLSTQRSQTYSNATLCTFLVYLHYFCRHRFQSRWTKILCVSLLRTKWERTRHRDRLKVDAISFTNPKHDKYAQKGLLGGKAGWMGWKDRVALDELWRNFFDVDPETAALQPGTVSVVPRAKEFTRGTKNRTTKHSDAPFLFFSSEKKQKKLCCIWVLPH